ncbi:MAG: hypothetical protein CBB97_13700 [Candidatus Endolissoclinum sp. TMED37]|nr:MAG: hypothetical protein CBB97_13700 [Candidatus Endolissoclinum sp. TMED37]
MSRRNIKVKTGRDMMKLAYKELGWNEDLNLVSKSKNTHPSKVRKVNFKKHKLKGNMTLNEIDAKIKELENLKKNELRLERGKDLSLVKEMCKKHGFTARMLRDSLGSGRNRRKKAQLEASV